MFGFSFGEILLIAAIALIAIGPKQLPDVARTLGRMLNQFRDLSSEFQKVLLSVRDETQRTVGKFNDSINKSINDPINEPTNKSLDAPTSGAATNEEAAPPQNIENNESKQLAFELSSKVEAPVSSPLASTDPLTKTDEKK